MVYTVKQLASLANVSTRTLHYYDEIGLLKPASYGDNGYRYYGKDAVLKLQQILFFKELDFSLDEIRRIVERPDFDLLHALQVHRSALQERAARLNTLIHTVDQTILYLKGKTEMSQSELFEGFTEEQQQEYVKRAEEQWGASVTQSVKLWNSYSAEKKQQVMDEAGAIYQEIVARMGQGATSPEVQALIGRWHQNLRYFYEPTREIMLGLGQGYAEHPEFRANLGKLHPDLPDFLREAITHYCAGLEA